MEEVSKENLLLREKCNIRNEKEKADITQEMIGRNQDKTNNEIAEEIGCNLEYEII
jgi:hypothetical protein